MRHSILGIDIAKSKFDVVLLDQGKQRHRIFSNCLQGFEQLSTWLVKQEVKQVHAWRGGYWHLWKSIRNVSIPNWSSSQYGQSSLHSSFRSKSAYQK